jgi:hypothetical protein
MLDVNDRRDGLVEIARDEPPDNRHRNRPCECGLLEETNSLSLLRSDLRGVACEDCGFVAAGQQPLSERQRLDRAAADFTSRHEHQHLSRIIGHRAETRY